MLLMKKKMLFLQQVVDDLLAVPPVGSIRHMHPVVALRVMLPNQLVEVAVRPDPLEPPFAFLQIPVDAEVCRLTILVLRVPHPAHGGIQSQTPVPAANLNGMPHRLPERLQHLMHQRTQINHVRLSRLVTDALRLRRRTRCQFLQREVFTDTYHIV